MTIKEVDQKLKEINPDFNIVPNPNNELASLYWKDRCMFVSMSKDSVPEVKNDGFCDSFGRPHRSYQDIEKRAILINEQLLNPSFVEELYMRD